MVSADTDCASLEQPSATAHLGRREHYRLARDLAAQRPKRATLMQRSSTLLLGPEDGWDHEASFHDEVWSSVEAGTQWYHVASLDGIERHLRRPTSRFPRVGVRPQHLIDVDGVVAIRSTNCHEPLPIRVLPPECTSEFGADFKIDRQARMLAAELDDDFEALVVADIGDQQLTIQLRGVPARTVFDACLALYERCPPLETEALRRCVDRILSAEENTR